MTTRTFRDPLRAQPFQPFRLVISSGQTYDVRHPEMAWRLHTDLLIGTDEAEDGQPTRYRTRSLPHVTAIEPLPTTAATGPGPG